MTYFQHSGQSNRQSGITALACGQNSSRHRARQGNGKSTFPVPLGFALCALLLIAGCEDRTSDVSEARPLRPVRTLVVEFPTERNSRDFPAVVDASKKADLSFKIAGKIVKIHVKQGQQVEAGQLLAELDDSDIQIQLNDARALFDKARADYERARKLIRTNVISQSDFDQLKAQFGSAEANPGDGRISNESPLGNALMEHQVGDKVAFETPGGPVEVEVLRIE